MISSRPRWLGSSYAPTILYEVVAPRGVTEEPTKKPEFFRNVLVAMTSPGRSGSLPRSSVIRPAASGLCVSISRSSVSSSPCAVRTLP